MARLFAYYCTMTITGNRNQCKTNALLQNKSCFVTSQVTSSKQKIENEGNQYAIINAADTLEIMNSGIAMYDLLLSEVSLNISSQFLLHPVAMWKLAWK